MLESIQQQIIQAKKESQLKLLKMIGSKVTELSDKENASARAYWSEFAKFIPEKYGFHSRNTNSISISKNHATDIINALLNYGYSVLAGEITKFVRI